MPATGGMVTSVNKHFLGNENGFLNDTDSPQNESAKKEHLPASTSQKLGIDLDSSLSCLVLKN